MSTLPAPNQHSVPRKWFLFGLLSATFAVNIIDVFAPMLYPEIAATFGITVGTAVQLSAFSALAGVLTGLLLSALSIRIGYKTLLTLGVLSALVCVLGVYLAPTFLFAQIFYALNGVGSVMVGVMTSSLIGEVYTLDKKATRMSWVLVTAALASLIGSPVTGFVANSGGVTSWRNALLWFMVPTTALCALSVFLLVPSIPRSTFPGTKKQPFLNGYKEVLKNRSAAACLANMFLLGAFGAASVFTSSFLKNIYGVDPAFRGLIGLASGILITAGFLVGGLLVHKAGRKRLTVLLGFVASVLTFVPYIVSVFLPNVWLFIAFDLVVAAIAGLAIVSGANLYLEQVPKYRGTVLSLTSALRGIGLAIGIILAGQVLNLVVASSMGYAVAITFLSFLGIIGTLLLHFFARDPVKNPDQTLPL